MFIRTWNSASYSWENVLFLSINDCAILIDTLNEFVFRFFFFARQVIRQLVSYAHHTIESVYNVPQTAESTADNPDQYNADQYNKETDDKERLARWRRRRKWRSSIPEASSSSEANFTADRLARLWWLLILPSHYEQYEQHILGENAWMR